MKPIRMTLAWRLIIWMMFLSILPITVMVWVIRANLTQDSLLLAAQNEEDEAVEAANYLSNGIPMATIQEQLGGKRRLAIIDQRGYYTSHTDTGKIGQPVVQDLSNTQLAEMFSQAKGSFINQPTHQLVSYADIPGTNQKATIILEYQAANYVSPPLHGLVYIILSVIASILLIGLATNWIAGKPLRKLAGMAEKIGEGQLDARVNAVEMTDEPKLLAETFNHMAQQIENMLTQAKTARNRMGMFARIFNTAQWGMWINTPGKLTVEMINPAFADMHGYTAQELSGMQFTDLLAEEDNVLWLAAIEQADLSGHLQYESNHRRKDGSVFPVLVDITTVKDEENKENTRIVNLQDISARKQAELAVRENEERLRSLVDAAFEGIGVTQAGKIIDASDQLCAMFGYRLDEIIGMPVIELVAPESRAIVLSHLLAGSEESYGHLSLRKDGSKFPVEVKGRSFLYRGLPCRVTTVRDITDRKNTELRLQRQVQRLNALRMIEMSISASLDLRLTLSILLEHVTTQLGANAASILLYNPLIQRLECVASRGFKSSDVNKVRVRLGQGFAGRAALERETVQATAQDNEPGRGDFPGFLIREGIVSYTGLPLIAKNQIKGVLEVCHRQPLETDPEWMGFAEAIAGQAAIAIDNTEMFENLRRVNLELILAYDNTLDGWVRALDLHDKESIELTQYLADITVGLARLCAISEAEFPHIRRGALLHDIGKMGIPDSILLKPGPLTTEEWTLMKQHPTYAYQLMSPITYLQPALDIPYSHHEKWDGSGYPRGLAGDAIPLSARVFAVVDVWDALRHDRPFRQAWPEQKILDYLREISNQHLDAQVVEQFLNNYTNLVTSNRF